jgi:hypothetical protein
MGFIRAGCQVYDYSLRDMSRFLAPIRSKYFGIRRVAKDLVATAKQFRPDLLLLGHVNLLPTDVWTEIKCQHPALRTIFYYVDPLFHAHNLDFLKRLVPHVDAFFATTGGKWLDDIPRGASVAAYFPNPVDPSIENLENHTRTHFSHELLFCGRASGEGVRDDLLRRLEAELPPGAFTVRGCLGRPIIGGADYLDLLSRCRGGLNYSRRNDVELYSSDRIAQLAGNGLLTYTPRYPSSHLILRDDEAVYFDSIGNLVEAVKWYADRPLEAAAIAQKGRSRYHALCDSQVVATYMMDILDKQYQDDAYPWGEHIFRK